MMFAPSASERHPTMASPAVDFARNNQPRFLDELKTLLRIPSISTLEELKNDVQKAAEFVAADLRRIGMENVEIIPTKGHPLLYADWLHAEGKPTVLMYAHYDVQPPDPLDEWKTPPFDPTERAVARRDRKSTRLNSSHANISYAVFCLKKKKKKKTQNC